MATNPMPIPLNFGQLTERVIKAIKVLFGADTDAETLGKLVREGLMEIARAQGELVMVETLKVKVQLLEVFVEVRKTDAMYDLAKAQMLHALGTHKLVELEERKIHAIENIANSLAQLLVDRYADAEILANGLHEIAAALRTIGSKPDMYLPQVS